MTLKGHIAILLAGLTLFAACGTSAQSRSPAFQMTWTLQPDPPKASPFLVSNWTEIDGGYIYPRKAVVLKAAAHPAGKRSFPAGTQLVAVDGGESIACTMYPHKKIDLKTFNSRSFGYYSCFIDSNADGAFEGYFEVQGFKDQVISGGEPTNTVQAMTPVVYENLVPDKLSGPPRLSIKFGQHVNIGSATSYSAFVGSSSLPIIEVPDSHLNEEISYAGIVFHVLRRDPRAILVELKQSLNRQVINFERFW